MDASELKATARLGILGSLDNNNNRQRWKFSGLDLSMIEINGKFSGFTMYGRLDLLENHPVYGKGFNADLKVEMSGAFEVTAKAIFGKKDFRYWYFDRIADMGCRFQMNLMSVTGKYGTDSLIILNYLLKRGLYSFTATDLHSLPQLDSIMNFRPGFLQRYRFGKLNIF